MATIKIACPAAAIARLAKLRSEKLAVHLLLPVRGERRKMKLDFRNRKSAVGGLR